MAVSVALDNSRLSALAERLFQARKIYGPDSPYVIGIFAGFDWLLAGTEGGDGIRQQLNDRVLELESGKAQRGPAEHVAPSAEGEGLVENNWVKGKVKWFNNDKGYGFISTESNTYVFVHWRDISSWDRSLAQGDEVEFMVTKTAKGFQAINVMKAGKEGAPGEGQSQKPEGGLQDDPRPENQHAPPGDTADTAVAPAAAES